MEALEPCVRYATARTEARKDIVFDGTEQRNILRIHGQVSGRGGPSQESGVFAREGIDAVPWVVIHNPAGDHRPQPFAHVTLFLISSLFSFGFCVWQMRARNERTDVGRKIPLPPSAQRSLVNRETE